ncbi:EAL domain-containing protein (putative c-di-GMP-specific phosphodiesterase class I) [Mycolicibacterium sp. BK556]|uniref:sensor domain-containing phosphodiesterase n=1 Tax=Mycobacteriaceae TaxID=1762 RepID=UPI00106104D2|nr:EAL domain-containing protein [Mycobacterium sp. BK086]MBB3602092.1 EAL domain-containing protein (putative c-di-GMP-specific phosphodiesterase class I) [Mycolicibacterium sp. BK556]MBB3631844.1 EAL domain-containing protein (putative c-di-GMP-specific phosphodiesterase class I) [Mycolicibacterium sp. BK607]TDO18864.1 EAL domain-containing protein (putative c-di-GMP-specific phosphodiesterase class I) [Mycobacterium sp. BK086]
MNADQLLARNLLSALASGRVEPYFQPIVSLDDGRVLGFEVLARWNDPEQGFISPDRFIPIADRFGLLDRLLDQMMRTSFAAAAEWPHNLFLGFNVSPTQLRNSELATRIARAAIEASFPLSRVHIEVTESGFIEDLNQPRRTLDRLINLGCMIAMDDFGTGYSSLTWLSSMPFSKLKIDASFVMAMHEHRQSRKIVAAVVGLGHSLGLAVVAEGVETAQQANLLRGMGCKLAQGFLFGRPTPASQVPDVLSAVVVSAANTESVPTSLELHANEVSGTCESDAAIAFMDPTGTVVASSTAFDRTMDVNRGEAAGQHIWDLIGVTPETFAELRATDLLDEQFPAIEETTANGSLARIMIRPVKDESSELLGYSVEFAEPTSPKAS